MGHLQAIVWSIDSAWQHSLWWSWKVLAASKVTQPPPCQVRGSFSRANLKMIFIINKYGQSLDSYPSITDRPSKCRIIQTSIIQPWLVEHQSLRVADLIIQVLVRGALSFHICRGPPGNHNGARWKHGQIMRQLGPWAHTAWSLHGHQN